MKRIVFATNNQHKLQEIRDILGSDYEVVYRHRLKASAISFRKNMTSFAELGEEIKNGISQEPEPLNIWKKEIRFILVQNIILN